VNIKFCYANVSIKTKNLNEVNFNILCWNRFSLL